MRFIFLIGIQIVAFGVDVGVEVVVVDKQLSAGKWLWYLAGASAFCLSSFLQVCYELGVLCSLALLSSEGVSEASIAASASCFSLARQQKPVLSAGHLLHTLLSCS